MNRKDLYKYQERAVQHILDVPKCALFLDMGLGKTVSTLTALEDLMYEDFSIKKVLLIAPLRVCNTVWRQESMKWKHTKILKFANLSGGKANMLKGLQREADVYMINKDNIQHLVNHLGKKWNFDMVIIDESSAFKSNSTQRFKAMKKITNLLERVVLLTGTPAPNGYMDLWSQFYLLDNGYRLGKTMTFFRNRYFDKDFMGYNYTLREGADKLIQEAIQDLVLSMSSEDYLELPEVISMVLENKLDGKLLKQYKELEKDMMLQLTKDDEILAMSAATLSNKLLQFSSGHIYDAEKFAHHVHNLKIDTLKEIREDSPNENLLVAYNYKHELAHILEHFPEAVVLGKGTKEVDAWNKGEIKMLLAHPASAGHGLNLQFGGSTIVWYGFTWSLELYQQFNKRLHRQGQKNTVRQLHIAVGDVETRLMETLASKDVTQATLLEKLKG